MGLIKPLPCYLHVRITHELYLENTDCSIFIDIREAIHPVKNRLKLNDTAWKLISKHHIFLFTCFYLQSWNVSQVYHNLSVGDNHVRIRRNIVMSWIEFQCLHHGVWYDSSCHSERSQRIIFGRNISWEYVTGTTVFPVTLTLAKKPNKRMRWISTIFRPVRLA